MSVLVMGMAMPSECEYCGFCRYYRENGNVWCNAKNKLLKKGWINSDFTHLDVKKPEWCPLVEVPTPHGRLIDEREAEQCIGDHMTCRSGREGRSDWQRVHDGLASTSTVIEAEGET